MKQTTHFGDLVLQFNPYHGRDGRFASAGAGASGIVAKISRDNPLLSDAVPATAEHVKQGQVVVHVDGRTGAFTGRYGKYQGRELPEVLFVESGKKDVYDLSRLRIPKAAANLPEPTIEPDKPKPTPPTPKTKAITPPENPDYQAMEGLKKDLSKSGATLLYGQWEKVNEHNRMWSDRFYAVNLPNGDRWLVRPISSSTYKKVGPGNRLRDPSGTRYETKLDLEFQKGGSMEWGNRRSTTLFRSVTLGESNEYTKVGASRDKVIALAKEKFGIDMTKYDFQF